VPEWGEESAGCLDQGDGGLMFFDPAFDQAEVDANTSLSCGEVGGDGFREGVEGG
jgi:hypothetical protein